MKISSSILTILFLLRVQVSLAGGGWPQEKGHGYFKVSQWWLVSHQHFTDVGLIDPNVTNKLFNTSFYGEYGITPRLTGIIYAPFYSRALFNSIVSGTTGEVLVPGEAINSFGDTDISLKYGLTPKKSVALSATLTLGLPLGNDRGGSQGNLQTGDGEFNQLLQIDMGKSYKLLGQNAYANVYAGFNNRTSGFSDEFRFGVETGVQLFDNRLIALVRVYGVKSLKNGSLADAITSTSVFANNSEHITVSPEVAWKFGKNWGVSATAGGAVYGRIIFASPAYSAGVFLTI
ncbi:MAG: hypothetical protein SF052_18050 [Bacteroidia bacterium]|nr:hypothetical protein [Bacteroidia bacterium]